MRGKRLQEKVLKIIQDNWPVHVREVISLLDQDPHDNANISKISYHFKTLSKNEKIRTKKIGKALVAWPMDMEKIRLMHEMLKDGD